MSLDVVKDRLTTAEREREREREREGGLEGDREKERKGEGNKKRQRKMQRQIEREGYREEGQKERERVERDTEIVGQPNAIFPPNPKISGIVFFSLDYSSLGCL